MDFSHFQPEQLRILASKLIQENNSLNQTKQNLELQLKKKEEQLQNRMTQEFVNSQVLQNQLLTFKQKSDHFDQVMMERNKLLEALKQLSAENILMKEREKNQEAQLFASLKDKFEMIIQDRNRIFQQNQELQEILSAKEKDMEFYTQIIEELNQKILQQNQFQSNSTFIELNNQLQIEIQEKAKLEKYIQSLETIIKQQSDVTKQFSTVVGSLEDENQEVYLENLELQREVGQLSQEYMAMKGQFSELEKENLKMFQEMEKQKKNAHSQYEKNKQLQQKNQELRKKLTEYEIKEQETQIQESTIEELQIEKTKLEQEIMFSQEENLRISEEKQKLQKELRGFKQENETYRKRYEGLEKEYKEQSKINLDLQDLLKSKGVLKMEKNFEQNKNTKLEIQDLKMELKDMNKKFEGETQKVKQYSIQYDQIVKEKQEIERKFIETKHELDKTTNELKAKESKLKKLQSAHDSLSSKFKEKIEKLESKLSKKKLKETSDPNLSLSGNLGVGAQESRSSESIKSEFQNIIEENTKIINESLKKLEDPQSLLIEKIENSFCVKAGKPEKLAHLLVCEENESPDFINDFLITFRTFTTTQLVMETLEKETIRSLENCKDSTDTKSLFVQKRVTQFFFLWITYFFNDFLLDPNVDSENLSNKTAQIDNSFLYKSPIFDQVNNLLLKIMTETKFEEIKRFTTKIIEKHNSKLQGFVPDDEVLIPSRTSGKTPKSKIPKRLDPNIDILSINPVEIARQLTLFEMNLFQKIQPSEFLKKIWSHKTKKTQKAANLLKLITRFNNVSLWVTTEVVKVKSLNQRTLTLQRFISIGKECRNLNNFNAVMEIIGGLHNACVHRMKNTWEQLPSKDIEAFEDLTTLMGAQGSYKRFRSELEKKANQPLIPYVGIFLTDLTFIEDGNPSTITDNSLINFDKHRMISKIILQIQKFQRASFDLHIVPEIQQALENLPFESDENVLYKMSLKNEPRQK
ncbi:guanine nucleotide exchange factor [Anaeramoeba ignava]|uniref:Guanine nucleotide exchange factor n=1 Tax=Anaeramoeba ignava TaxID=1746090 RepID=A0A9Q0LHS9_ANAIG|nr:guanine nucleotide exchange factor [Anaeramoeba ignava]